MGVYSRSTEKGYRLFEGREAYNEWRFTEESLGVQGRDGWIRRTRSGPIPASGGVKN